MGSRLRLIIKVDLLVSHSVSYHIAKTSRSVVYIGFNCNKYSKT